VSKTYLVSGAAGQRAQGALDGARCLVGVALEGGGLVFVVGRHCGDRWMWYVKSSRGKSLTVCVLGS
jgi:hypothetical protein